MQCQLQDYFCISQKARWSIVLYSYGLSGCVAIFIYYLYLNKLSCFKGFSLPRFILFYFWLFVLFNNWIIWIKKVRHLLTQKTVSILNFYNLLFSLSQLDREMTYFIFAMNIFCSMIQHVHLECFKCRFE